MNAVATKEREPRIVVEDLPAEHLAELEFLWARRETMLRSPEHFLSHLADTDRRIQANAVGLEVATRPALPVLEEAMGEKLVSLVAAAAWVLLRIGGERASAAVFTAIEAGTPAAREGARQALVVGPAAALLDRLRPLRDGADAGAAVAAAEVLAAHGTPGVPRALEAWLADPAPEVRMAACRVAAWTGGAASSLEAPARNDTEDAVRAAACEAGAWLKAPWALAHARERAKAKDASRPEALALFGIVAEDSDSPLVLALGAELSLGPARWEVLASHGSPACLRACLTGMESKEAADAEAAGLAFVRMTGANLGAAKRVTLAAPAGAGPDAEEFADEAFVPDPKAAQRHWEEHQARYEKGRRWCRGVDVGKGGVESAAAVDLRSRFVLLLRARYRGGWSGSLRELLLLPR